MIIAAVHPMSLLEFLGGFILCVVCVYGLVWMVFDIYGYNKKDK